MDFAEARRGMWVTFSGNKEKEVPGGTAIIVDRRDPEACEIHMVDDKGETVMVVKGVKVEDLTKAAPEDIPSRPGVNKANLRRFGYMPPKDPESVGADEEDEE
jgi:hypothetical protein